MSKLYKLKEWLTLDDAASHLSKLLDEPVSVADVMRLGLDSRITLSVYFVNGTYGKRLVAVPEKDLRIAQGLEGHDVILADQLPDGRYAVTDDTLTTLTGVWDLTMWGGERLDVEARYQRLIEGPEVTLVDTMGAIVRNDDGAEYVLYTHFDYGGKDVYPPSDLPEDALIVVRTAALAQFLESLTEENPKTDLDPREYTTLYKMLLSFARHHYDYDSSKERQDATAKIQRLVQRHGYSISADAIRRQLKAASDRLD